MEANIHRIMKSVIITTIIVLFSIPIWNYTSHKNSLALADAYGNLDIAVDIGGFSALTLVENNRAFDVISPTDLSFRNQNDFKKDFEILFLVTKDSTVDPNFINVSLDNKVYSLKNLERREDEENSYFVLRKESLDAYSEIQYKTRIWLDAEAARPTENSILTTNFIAE